jgi:hypothetical protein
VKRSPAQSPAVPPGYPSHLQPGQPAPTLQHTPMQINLQPGQLGPAPQAQMSHAHMMMRQPGPQAGQGKPGAPQIPTGSQGLPMHPSQMHPPQQQPVCGISFSPGRF